jgi:predicted nucleic acid-binding protein
MLDTGPLGRLAHRNVRPEVSQWLADLLTSDLVLIPEIAFELRRNLVFERLSVSIERLDRLVTQLEYVPLTTRVMRRAANMWAEARWRGRPTADPKELDADVILASQAIEASATIATDNVGHLAQFVAAVHWRKVGAR